MARSGQRQETVIDCNRVYYRKAVQASTRKSRVTDRKDGMCKQRVVGEKEGQMMRSGTLGLITIRPSLSLQAQVTPAPQPFASHTTNHLVLITRIFSPFVPPSLLLPSPYALLCGLAFAKVHLILF